MALKRWEDKYGRRNKDYISTVRHGYAMRLKQSMAAVFLYDCKTLFAAF